MSALEWLGAAIAANVLDVMAGLVAQKRVSSNSKSGISKAFLWCKKAAGGMNCAVRCKFLDRG